MTATYVCRITCRSRYSIVASGNICTTIISAWQKPLRCTEKPPRGDFLASSIRSFRAELKKGKRMWDGRRENVYINIRLRGTRDKSLDKVPDAAPTSRKFRRALSEETECFEMLGERKRADARERKQKQRNMRAWDEIERVGIFNLLRQQMFAKKK